MNCKICRLQNLLMIFAVIIVAAVFYNTQDEHFDETMHVFLSVVAIFSGVAILFYAIKNMSIFLWKVANKVKLQNILIYTFMILLLVIILFPPYIVTNKNHVPTQTGYGFLFSLDEIKYKGYAASVDIQLLLIHLFTLLILFWALFFLALKKNNPKNPKDDFYIDDIKDSSTYKDALDLFRKK